MELALLQSNFVSLYSPSDFCFAVDGDASFPHELSLSFISAADKMQSKNDHTDDKQHCGGNDSRGIMQSSITWKSIIDALHLFQRCNGGSSSFASLLSCSLAAVPSSRYGTELQRNFSIHRKVLLGADSLLPTDISSFRYFLFIAALSKLVLLLSYCLCNIFISS